MTDDEKNFINIYNMNVRPGHLKAVWISKGHIKPVFIQRDDTLEDLHCLFRSNQETSPFSSSTEACQNTTFRPTSMQYRTGGPIEISPATPREGTTITTENDSCSTITYIYIYKIVVVSRHVGNIVPCTLACPHCLNLSFFLYKFISLFYTYKTMCYTFYYIIFRFHILSLISK